MTNFERIFQDLGELKAVTKDTLEQTKKTNGRVTKLEERMEGVDVKFAGQAGYKKGFTAARVALIGVLSFVLGSVVVPLVSAYISHK